MEERQTIFDMARRSRQNCCRICGGHIDREEAFYSDGQTSVHLCCFFDYQSQEDKQHEHVV